MSDALIDALVVYGEAHVAARLSGRRRGCGEIIAHPLLAGRDRATSLAKAMQAVARTSLSAAISALASDSSMCLTRLVPLVILG
jgi:hypothetical protein